jgi:hypothetical protein
MKVSKLIEYLKTLDPDAIVILSKDAEGNGFSPITGDHSEGIYVPDTNWSGEFYCNDDIAEEDDIDTEGAVRAVVLWPIN